VLHYANDPSLWDVVVLQPEWLTSAISQVLDDDETRRADGVLEHVRLVKIWQVGPDGQPYTDRVRRYLLGLMWRFAVAYKLEDRDASLVTQLVLATAPSLPWSHESVPRPGWQVQSLEWQLEEPAPGLLAQLTVKTRLYATGLYWQTGVFLRPAQQPATQALITLDTDNPQRLQLTVQTAVPSLVFGELIGIVRQLLAARWKGLTYQELLRCPTVLDATIRCSGLFQMAEVNRQLGRADPKLQCSKCSVVWEGAALLAGGHRPPGDQLRHGELVALADQSLAGAIAGEQLAAVVRAEVLAANRPLHDKLNRQADYISDLRQGVGRIQHGQTHGQLALHALLQITMDHYRAGIARPKLFTLVPADGRFPRLQGIVRVRLELALWCMDRRGAHPHKTYTISRPARWLRTVAPYLRIASAALAMAAGVGPAAIAVAIPKLDSTARDKINLTAKLAEHLLAKRGQPPQQQAHLDSTMTDTANIAHDAKLRRVNELIDEADPAGDYGGLGLRLASSGQLLWACPAHAADYDLPDRSPRAAAPPELTRVDSAHYPVNPEPT